MSERIKIALSSDGIDFLKNQKCIYTKTAALIGRDSDTIKRWVRQNSEQLTLASVVVAVKKITKKDISCYFEQQEVED